MITNGLYALITGNTAIAAMISTRLYPVKLPEGVVYPTMTYQVISQVGDPNVTTAGLQRMRIQFDCYGSMLSPAGVDGYSDAVLLRDALRQLLDGYVGTLSDGTVLQNAVRIQSVDYFDDDARVYRCMCEFNLWFVYSS